MKSFSNSMQMSRKQEKYFYSVQNYMMFFVQIGNTYTCLYCVYISVRLPHHCMAGVSKHNQLEVPIYCFQNSDILYHSLSHTVRTGHPFLFLPFFPLLHAVLWLTCTWVIVLQCLQYFPFTGGPYIR